MPASHEELLKRLEAIAQLLNGIKEQKEDCFVFHILEGDQQQECLNQVRALENDVARQAAHDIPSSARVHMKALVAQLTDIAKSKYPHVLPEALDPYHFKALDDTYYHPLSLMIREACIALKYASMELRAGQVVIAPKGPFSDLNLHADIIRVMDLCWKEAQRCIEHECWISAIVMCAKILETMTRGLFREHGGRINVSTISGAEGRMRLVRDEIPDLLSYLRQSGVTFPPAFTSMYDYVRRVRNFVIHDEVLNPEPNRNTALSAFHFATDLAEYCRANLRHHLS